MLSISWPVAEYRIPILDPGQSTYADDDIGRSPKFRYN